MAQLQPIVCKLADRPKSYSHQGKILVDGKWVNGGINYNTGEVKSHVSKTLKGKGKYYVS